MATSYEEKKRRLLNQFSTDGGPVGLNKHTSNLFRDRQNAPKRTLNVRDLNTVLQVDSQQGWVETEGMTSYQDLVNATLKESVMPSVVPQLKSITIGGAVSGIGIESSSFKYGLVHETVLAMEVLLGDGRVVVCTPDNEYRDLFYGIPNTYGTLGYILKLKVKTIPVKPYVRLQHLSYRDAELYFRDLNEWCRKDVDFIDGTVFGANQLHLTLGTFTDDAPFTSDYTFEHIYYRSIPRKQIDYLSTLDYIWRWDTDWFWCSKNLFVQHPIVRRLVGKSRLNSVTYTKVMRWNSRWGLTRRLNRLFGRYPESVIQDVDIPIDKASAFLDFFHNEIGITPVWICPIHAYDGKAQFPLYPMNPNTLYVNFGFWDVVKSRKPQPAGFYNRKIEAKVAELGGIKSLYSDAYYEQEAFWKIYNQTEYDRLKTKYDPQHAFKNLYEKTVLHG